MQYPSTYIFHPWTIILSIISVASVLPMASFSLELYSHLLNQLKLSLASVSTLVAQPGQFRSSRKFHIQKFILNDISQRGTQDGDQWYSAVILYFLTPSFVLHSILLLYNWLSIILANYGEHLRNRVKDVSFVERDDCVYPFGVLASIFY